MSILRTCIAVFSFCFSQVIWAQDSSGGVGLFAAFDSWVGSLNGLVASVLFANVFAPFTDSFSMPLAVVWLIVGAVYFTVRMQFISLRGFKHALQIVRGKYSDENSVGDVTHFQALSSALSATVGLGNIAGVAIAVSIGGPGATFWMIVAGFLGMSSKFAECTLAQMYREVRPDGRIMGGAMEYLSRGLKEMGFAKVGQVLAIIFCVLCIGGSLGGGNAFQVNQSLRAVQEAIPFFGEHKWVYGLIMAIATGIVIIGGIKRIAQTAEVIVPFMCGIYVLACLYIIVSDAAMVPAAFGKIIGGAFAPDAIYGGIAGVLIQGFKRAAFSNEAGVGSAAIAHSAAKTKFPVREGLVSLLEPFIDTIVICTMTALVIVITGAYENPAYSDLIANANGAGLTSRAFSEKIPFFKYVLSLSVALFAYSTMISWSYYGERCWAYMFGEKASMIYKIGFVVIVFFSATISAANVLDFSDLMILAMAFPNMFGVFILSGKVKRQLDEYWARYKSGEFN